MYPGSPEAVCARVAAVDLRRGPSGEPMLVAWVVEREGGADLAAQAERLLEAADLRVYRGSDREYRGTIDDPRSPAASCTPWAVSWNSHSPLTLISSSAPTRWRFSPCGGFLPWARPG